MTAPLWSFAAALAGGVALFWSQPPRRGNWQQFAALGALFWAVNHAPTAWWAAGCGLIFALSYVALQLWELRLHPAINAILALSQSAVWTGFALGTFVFESYDAVPRAFLTASLGTFLVWLEWSVLPLWGTAQNFARGWSREPRLVQFVALSGVSGAVWCLILLTALATQIVSNPQDFPQLGAVLLIVVTLVAALDIFLWDGARDAPTLRVAAFGWGENDSLTDRNLQIIQAIRAASEKGAKLLVTPESAFQIPDRAAFRRIFGELAKTHKIALAIGYFDLERNKNCTDLFNFSGEVEGRYVKTRLVPLFENYQRGTGETAHLKIDGIDVGSLICQDDNFAAGAARYGRSQTQILAIPTHDWRSVKDFHAANSLWRALEFRLGLIKAASGGISYIASPRGELLARCDHITAGAQLLVADLPLYGGKATLYARCGDFFPVACGLVALGALLSRVL